MSLLKKPQQQNEIQALDFRLRELGVFIERALRTETMADFFYTLGHCIAPILFSIPFLEPLRKNWVSEKEAFENKCHNLETRAIAEIREVFSGLAQITSSNDDLSGILNGIEKVLEGTEPYFAPSYYEVVYEKICTFCHACLDSDRLEWISSLVEIREGKSGKRITKFLFAPHVLKLRSFKAEVHHWKNPCDWVVWEHVYAAYWAWKTDFSFFSRKKISSMTPVKCQHSMQRLEQLNLWQEMQWIKKKRAAQSNKKPVFFTVPRFSDYLKRLIDQILKFQVETKPHKPSDTDCLFSLELVLQPYELHLIVEWVQGGIKNAYVLKHFQGEGEPLRFIKNIFDSEVGTKVYLPQGSSQTAAKLMHQSNLKRELFNLFFENRGIDWVIPGNKKIVFTGTEAIDFISLKKRILEFTPAVRFYV